MPDPAGEVDDRMLLVVVGLPELGHLLAEAKPEGAEVVTVTGGPGVARRFASQARGATRANLLCVIADTGDAEVDRLPGRLAGAGFRVLVLTGLPGATGRFTAEGVLRVLPAPFTVNDVLAELSALPGDVPFFLPVEGGERVFGAPDGGDDDGDGPDLAAVLLGDDHDDDDPVPDPGEAGPGPTAVGGGLVAGLAHGTTGGDDGDERGGTWVAGPAARPVVVRMDDERRAPAGAGPAADGRRAGSWVEPDDDELLGARVPVPERPVAASLPEWARLPPQPGAGATGFETGAGATDLSLDGASVADPILGGDLPGWLVGPGTGPVTGRDGGPPVDDLQTPSAYASRALDRPPVVSGAPLPGGARPGGRRHGEVLAVCSYKGGSGKCLTGDALVVDPVTGLPHRLDAVVRDPAPARVLTLDGETVRAVPITAKVDSGVQPTLRLTLESGRSITATPHHPLLTPAGWRRLDGLVPGDVVAVPATLPFPERPRRLSPAALARLGEALAARGPVAPVAMPSAAFRLPADQLARLVAGLCDRVGGLGGDGPPEVVLASAALARSFQHLLLRLGVHSRVAPARSGGGGDAPGGGWRVVVPRDAVGRLAGVVARARRPGRPAPGAGDDGEPGVRWDGVVAVDPAGDQQVWDLSVEPTRCFVANDVVVHNTTTAVLAAGALARAVAPAGKRVALVDANTAQSSISTTLRPRSRASILDLARTDVDEQLLSGALTSLDEVEGLDILFGAPDLRSADGRLVTPALYRRVVATLRRTHDYVLVDTPVAEAVGHALFDDFVLRDADRVLVVLDPNSETVRNNAEWLDIIGDPPTAGGRNFPPERIGIVLNRAEPGLAWDAEAVARYFRRYQFLGALPRNSTVQRAADEGRLLARFDPAVERAVRAVLARTVDEPALVDRPDDSRSGVERVLFRLLGLRPRG